jgi:hypothetical protein
LASFLKQAVTKWAGVPSGPGQPKRKELAQKGFLAEGEREATLKLGSFFKSKPSVIGQEELRLLASMFRREIKAEALS